MEKDFESSETEKQPVSENSESEKSQNIIFEINGKVRKNIKFIEKLLNVLGILKIIMGSLYFIFAMGIFWMEDFILAITNILFGVINIILALKIIKFKNTLQNFSENEDENMLRNFVNKEVSLILKAAVSYILTGYSINLVYTFFLIYNNMHR